MSNPLSLPPDARTGRGRGESAPGGAMNFFRIVFIVIAVLSGLGGFILASETGHRIWWWYALGAVILNVWFAALSDAVAKILARLERPRDR